MSVANRLRTWVLRGMVKAAGLPVPFVPEWRRVQFMSPTFRALCQEGVKANAIVFNCLSVLARAYPEPRLRVYREGNSGLEPVPNHPLQALLNRPNPQMGQAELLQHAILYEAIGGNCYLYKVRSQARKVVELLPLNDSQITPVAGATLPIDHYDWANEETGKDEAIPAEDICQLKWMPDPLAPWRGLAPLIAVAREVDTDNEARRYLFTLLKNDATPRLVVTMPPGVKPLSDDEYKRLTVQWQERHGGANRGLPFVAGGGMDVKRVGLDLQELAFEGLARLPESRISGSFGVPAILAGLMAGLDSATYSNVANLRRYFIETTMMPLWRMDADEIGSDLLPEFGGSAGLIVAFDTSSVVALQEAVAEKRTWANDALARGGITRNEYRAALGYPSDPNGNVYLMPLTVQEVPAGIVASAAKALLPARETKAAADRRKIMLALIAAQRGYRAEVAGRMEGALNNYFGGLADRIIHRALTAAAHPKSLKAMVPWDELMFASDDAELEALLKRFYIELAQLSWDGWNLELGVDVAFDLGDPAVTKALEGTAARVKAIQETTRAKLQEALQFGSDNGWSIDHLVRGDAALGKPGLRDLIEQTYKGRAQNISRTELAHAQATAAANRYAAAGVDRVLIMDGMGPNSDEACNALNNTIQSLAWFQAHPIAHPSCRRAGGAAFPDDGPIDDAAHAAWQAAGGDSPVIGGR